MEGRREQSVDVKHRDGDGKVSVTVTSKVFMDGEIASLSALTGYLTLEEAEHLMVGLDMSIAGLKDELARRDRQAGTPSVDDYRRGH